MSEILSSMFYFNLFIASLGTITISYQWQKHEKEKSLRCFIEKNNEFLYENTTDIKELKRENIIIKDDLKKVIENILETKNFNAEVLKAFKTLLETTNNNNLMFCVFNLEDLTFEKIKNHKIPFMNKNFNGLYLHDTNKIMYLDYEALAHEILHMASSNHQITYFKSGFEKLGKHTSFFRGLNEGYTQLLTRRKFFDNNYDTVCYQANVYALLMLELLFENKEILENAYFHNDTDFFYYTFSKYGSKKEFFEINKFLDFFSETTIYENEDIQVLKLLKKIVERTGDTKKINQSLDIMDSYFSKQKKLIKH